MITSYKPKILEKHRKLLKNFEIQKVIHNKQNSGMKW